MIYKALVIIYIQKLNEVFFYKTTMEILASQLIHRACSREEDEI